VIPDFVLKILEKQQDPLHVLGDGRQIRAFSNVHDIAKGVYKCAFKHAAANDTFNLGSEDGIEMRDLARKIWERSDRNSEIEFEMEDVFKNDFRRRIPSSQKTKDILGWEPKISLEESLDEWCS
jgi:nucleoside-diphosphate-sugar epimerase